MEEVVAVSYARTAIGNFGGTLKDFSAAKLGSIVVNEVLKRAGLRPEVGRYHKDFGPSLLKNDLDRDAEKLYKNWDSSLRPVFIDEVIMGNVIQAGQGQNISRQSAIYADIPDSTPAYTVNKVCGSGLKSIILAAQSIMLGNADIVIAGGTESMSNTPYILPKARWGYRMDINAKGDLIDSMVYDGLWEIFNDYHMGITAESIAQKYKISRDEQDEIAYLSNQRAMQAIKDGLFEDEILAVEIVQKKAPSIFFKVDEKPRETTRQYLSSLKPVFKKDGTVTAGNSSGISDGAAALLLMSGSKANELGLKPMARIIGWSIIGLNPEFMGLGPAPAIKKLLKETNNSINDIDVIEINEAFASQAVACLKELNITYSMINPHGSGISLGHPIGCTGARIAVSLINDMNKRDLKLGLQALCIGGGMGIAAIWKR